MSVHTFFAESRCELEMALADIVAKRDLRTLKEDGSYVTEGDLLTQQIIVGCFTRSFPEGVIVSEEMKESHDGIGRGMVLVLDPIDGTENFTSGLPEWGVSISCYLNGTHAGSMLACPEMGWWLVSGEPVARRFASRIAGLSSSLSKEDLLRATEGFEYRVMGCCVYNMFNVIRGSFHSFENPKGANSWDILAGLNLALEHGLGVFIDGKSYAGEYLLPNRKYRFKIQQR